MLKLLLILVILGAILGLIFSRSGEEAEGALRGAKTGAKIGCGCGCLILIISFVLFILAASLGYLEEMQIPGFSVPAPSGTGTTTTLLR